MSTTISTVLISYDVNAKHSDVKADLVTLGYRDSFTLDRLKVYHLPNTTLWHASKSSDQAMADMKKVCIDLRVVLERAVAVRANDFVGL